MVRCHLSLVLLLLACLLSMKAQAQSTASTTATSASPSTATTTSASASSVQSFDSASAIASLNATLLSTMSDVANSKLITDQLTALQTSINQPLANLGYGLNALWTVVGGCLVIFMQAGFLMVEAGLVRTKNAVHVSAMNIMVFATGYVGFWLLGYAFAFGADPAGAPDAALGETTAPGGAAIGQANTVWLFTGGYALSGKAYDSANMAFFFYMAAFMDTTATIPTGSMAERWKWWSFVFWGLYCGAWYYPMFAGWAWGGGWLSQLGNSWGLGFGYVDFAGSGVIHANGGIAGLMGAIVIGPRVGRFDKETGKPIPVAPHNVPMVAVGVVILLFGWFGFNGASTLAAADLRFIVCVTNTATAFAFAGFASIFYVPLRLKTNDFCVMMNCTLAGLVAITAPCAFVAPWAAAVIGMIACVICVEGGIFLDWCQIDDAVGAFQVHFLNGLWGVISLGLFADGKYGQGWNGTAGAYQDGNGVTGLFYSGNLGGRQLGAQLMGCLMIVTWNAFWSYAFFKLMDVGLKFAGFKSGIRHDDALDEAGQDVSEMSGAVAYPEFVSLIQVEKLINERVAAALKAAGAGVGVGVGSNSGFGAGSSPSPYGSSANLAAMDGSSKNTNLEANMLTVTSKPSELEIGTVRLHVHEGDNGSQ